MKRLPGEIIENRVNTDEYYAVMQADLDRLIDIEIDRELAQMLKDAE